ncbi:MerR family transcriptional regulator [Anaerosporobacter faecicola]|uniref:MerR family transcriptional regulator n=1 Tax=Anaerosporobacter faecicola TaxID=2718714 RepID=UPI001439EDA4|nr:MerR family transcriptional regulator [Anaerosporobacter faecicola]
MFRIGEFSKITQVSIRMLRYYDEQRILIPACIDEQNGYRMYTAEQIEQLNRVLILKNLGLSVKEIKELLINWEPDRVRDMLENQLVRTQKAIEQEQERYRQIQGYLQDWDKQEEPQVQIVLKKIPAYYVLSLRRVMKNYYCEEELWKELMETTSGLEGHMSFSVYHDLDYREENVDIEACVVIDGQWEAKNGNVICRQIEEVPVAASFMIYGPYANISPAYRQFAYWLEQHPEYKMAGENRQICHVSMCHTENPEEYITELQIPLESTV